MLRLDEAGVVAERKALGVGERLLEFGRQFVEAHGNPLSTFTVWVFAVRFQLQHRALDMTQRSRRVVGPFLARDTTPATSMSPLLPDDLRAHRTKNPEQVALVVLGDLGLVE